MKAEINRISKEVVNHFEEEYKWELADMCYPDCIVLEDDVESELHIEGMNKEYCFTYGVIVKHSTYKRQDYIVLLINND